LTTDDGYGEKDVLVKGDLWGDKKGEDVQKIPLPL
jgi:hypothetical protein